MSIKLIYFVHGTTIDNENDKCTGWADGELSELGIKQAIELKKQIKEKDFTVIFCSDLKRAIDSVELGFKNEYPVIQDKRLRECDYGNLTQSDESLVNYSEHIKQTFPGGESLQDVEARMRDFIAYLKREYSNQFIAIMAHKAPQLALEVILRGKSWEEATQEDWRHKKAWQAGWLYDIKD